MMACVGLVLAVLMVISTLIDIPATVLNVSGNVVASALVDRLAPTSCR